MNTNTLTLLPRLLYRHLRSSDKDHAYKPLIVVAVLYFGAQIVRGLL